MKDAYGDGNAIRGIAIGFVLTYGFIAAIYFVYRLALWAKTW